MSSESHGRGSAGNPGKGLGQQKMHVIQHPKLGQQEVTQQMWREGGQDLRAQGWTRVDEQGQEVDEDLLSEDVPDSSPTTPPKTTQNTQVDGPDTTD
jgi:hypothetical protein